jgi:uncharacterized protein YlxP (DUF503 family)
MIVGLLTIHIYMRGIGSLKEKRSIVKSLVERLKSRFNASVSEVDQQDSKSVAVIGVATVANDSIFVNQSLDSIANFAGNDGRFYITKMEREIFAHHED